MKSKIEKKLQVQLLNEHELRKINGGDGGLWYTIWKTVGRAYGDAFVSCAVSEMPKFDASALDHYGAPY